MSVMESRREDIEHALRKSKERFRLVVEAAPTAMIMIGPDNLIEMVNTRTEQLYGYNRAELLGRPVDLLAPERLRTSPEELQQQLRANSDVHVAPGERILYGLRKDGSEFPIEVSLNAIDTEDGRMTLTSVIDVSDRMQKEESLRAAVKEKDALLGEVHHRVKNNLQIILSLLDLQSSRIEDQQAVKMLRNSQDRIRSMAIIHQTLYESKNFTRVDFRSFLDTLLPGLASSYEAGLERVVSAVEGENVLLPINTAIPAGLLVNELTSNALKHGFPDNKRGALRISLTKDGEKHAVLMVTDTGVGIPAHIDPTKGDTLGFQLINLLTRQLGGELKIGRCDPTCFTLRFPIER